MAMRELRESTRAPLPEPSSSAATRSVLIAPDLARRVQPYAYIDTQRFSEEKQQLLNRTRTKDRLAWLDVRMNTPITCTHVKEAFMKKELTVDIAGVGHKVFTSRQLNRWIAAAVAYPYGAIENEEEVELINDLLPILDWHSAPNIAAQTAVEMVDANHPHFSESELLRAAMV